MIDDLLNEFARTIGLDAIEPDDEPCILEFDGNPVSLSYRNNKERLLLYSDAGFLVRPAPELLLGLLQANALHHTVGDGNIGLVVDEHRGGFVVVYSQLLVTATLDLAKPCIILWGCWKHGGKAWTRSTVHHQVMGATIVMPALSLYGYERNHTPA